MLVNAFYHKFLKLVTSCIYLAAGGEVDCLDQYHHPFACQSPIMSPSTTNGQAGAKPPATKPAQSTPDHKTSEDPRTNSVHQALAQHPYGGAANLRDIYTNQGEYKRAFLSSSPCVVV